MTLDCPVPNCKFKFKVDLNKVKEVRLVNGGVWLYGGNITPMIRHIEKKHDRYVVACSLAYYMKFVYMGKRND